MEGKQKATQKISLETGRIRDETSIKVPSTLRERDSYVGANIIFPSRPPERQPTVALRLSRPAGGRGGGGVGNGDVDKMKEAVGMERRRKKENVEEILFLVLSLSFFFHAAVYVCVLVFFCVLVCVCVHVCV